MEAEEIKISSNVETEVSIVDSEDEFFRMWEEWSVILQNSSSDTIFLTLDWLSRWWKVYGEGKELFILLIKREGALVGIAPFYKKNISKFRFFTYRSIILLGDGSGDSDYLDFISLKGQEELVARSVINFLIEKNGEWDLLIMNEIPDASPHISILRKIFYQKRWYRDEEKIPCTYIKLPENWEDYIKSLKPRMRTKIRSLTKRLEKEYQVYFDRCELIDDIKPRLKSLFELHKKRWQQVGQEGVFLSKQKRELYYEISKLFLLNGWLRFYSLSFENHYIAHQFCFEYQNKIFLLQEGLDPNWFKNGAGNVLRGYIIKDCIERKVQVYDFLGGVSDHKLSWSPNIKNSIRISAGHPSLKNILIFKIPIVIGMGKKVIERYLPESALNWIKAVKKEITNFLAKRIH